MSENDSTRLLFLVKGTRGDVQPAAALAQAVKHRLSHLHVVLATHACHKSWLRDILNDSVQSVYMSSEPARHWQKEEASAAAEAAAFQSDGDLEESVLACKRALQLQQEIVSNGSQARQTFKALIIFNLFALEGFHIAEALCLPCTALSPCLVPYSPPAAFQRRFKKSAAAMYQALQTAEQGHMGWREVEHWMWPLFAPKWAHWRQHRLGLPPFLSNCLATPPPSDSSAHCQTNHGTLPKDIASAQDQTNLCTPQHDNALTHHPAKKQCLEVATLPNSEINPSPKPSGSQSAEGNVEGRLESVAQPLPRPVPLLYGLSPLIMQPPGYWPGSIHMCGFWQQPQPGQATALQAKLQSLVGGLPDGMSFADWHDGKPMLCITFGSMGPVGAIPDPLHLVEVLVAALRRINAKGVLLTGGWKRLIATAWTKSYGDPNPPLLAADAIPHEWLLPMCDAIVHHGGAGTCGAALRAGLPQLICPFHFDQHSWAEKLEYMGVAMQGNAQDLCQARDAAQGNQDDIIRKLAKQLQVLLSGQMKQQCQQLQTSLLQEDGVGTAVDLISQHVKLTCTPQVDAMFLQPPAGDCAQQHEHADGVQPDADSQELLQLPNGWQVNAESQLEATYIYNEIFGEEQVYMQYGVQIHEGDVVVDVGANVGLFIAWLMEGDPSKARGVPGKIWACEPLPANLARLRSNLDQHGLTDTVAVIPEAVSNEVGELQFRYYPHMPGNSTCHVQEKEELQGMMPAYFFADAQDCICPVTTVSKLIEDNSIEVINLLKVDVEGSESQVLQGIQPHHWRQIKQVLLETHDIDDRLQQICSLLQQQGYRVKCKHTGPMTNCMVYAISIGSAQR